MSDNPMDDLPSFNRVSIRAVLVTDGQDPKAALAAAGIFDPIAIPVVLGEGSSLSGGILGDAVTPNLTAVLEPDREDEWASSSPSSNRTSAAPPPEQRENTVGTVPPEALGRRPFAPVGGRLGG
jgi:hypothetical protein